jgi:DNA-binding Lrp family transcriptional regulator
LQENGRITYRTLAEKVNASLTSVQTRIKKLTDAGIIKGYQAVLDCSKIGYREMLMLNCSVNSSTTVDAVLQDLEQVGDIKMLYVVTGEYPIFLLAKCLSKEEQMALYERIRHIPGIDDIKTQVVIKKVKEDLRIRIPSVEGENVVGNQESEDMED